MTAETRPTVTTEAIRRTTSLLFGLTTFNSTEFESLIAGVADVAAEQERKKGQIEREWLDKAVDMIINPIPNERWTVEDIQNCLRAALAKSEGAKTDAR